MAASDPESAAVTAHARERAAATGNPLWIFALAARTADVADLALIHAAHATLAGSGIAEVDRAALDVDLTSHEARILLMAGRLDDAIATVRTMTDAGRFYYSQTIGRDAVSQAGTLYLVGRRDLASARIWANATKPPAWPGRSEFNITPSLAMTWQELLKLGWAANRRKDHPRTPRPARSICFPPREWSLCRTPGLAAGWRRPLLSAGWLRLYMLHRDNEFFALFPEMRSAFPGACRRSG